jgi:hypothetical protein
MDSRKAATSDSISSCGSCSIDAGIATDPVVTRWAMPPNTLEFRRALYFTERDPPTMLAVAQF